MVSFGLKTIPIQLISGMYDVPVCSKGTWDRLRSCKSDIDFTEAGGALLEGVPLPLYECRLLVTAYIRTMEEVCSELGLEIPYYKVEEEPDDVKYVIYTQPDKLVADYANMSIYDVDGISVIDYKLLLRDAFIARLSQTEKGRTYLKNAYRLTQTEADENLDLKGAVKYEY